MFDPKLSGDQTRLDAVAQEMRLLVRRLKFYGGLQRVTAIELLATSLEKVEELAFYLEHWAECQEDD